MRLKNTEIQDSFDNDYSPSEDDFEPVSEEGTWTIGWREKEHHAVLESSDFTHDVIMVIKGDFGSKKRALEYAQIIADRLNSFNPKLNQRM